MDDRVGRANKAANEDRMDPEGAEEEDYGGMHVEDYEHLSPSLLIPHNADKNMLNADGDPGTTLVLS